MYSNKLKSKISKLFRVGLTISEVSKIYTGISKSTLYQIRKKSEQEPKILGESALYIALIKNNSADMLKTKYEDNRNKGKVKQFLPIHNNGIKRPYTKKEINRIQWIYKMIDEQKLTLNSILDIKTNLQQYPYEFNSNIIMARIYQHFGLDKISIDMLNEYKNQVKSELKKERLEQIIKNVNNKQKIRLPNIVQQNKPVQNKTKKIVKLKDDKQIISEIRKAIYIETITIKDIEKIKQKISNIENKTLATILLSEVYQNLGLSDFRNCRA